MANYVLVCGNGSKFSFYRRTRIACGSATALQNGATLLLSVEKELTQSQIEENYLQYVKNSLKSRLKVCRSSFTIDEARKAVKLANKGHEVTVCTSFWHIPRIWAIVKKVSEGKSMRNLKFKAAWAWPSLLSFEGLRDVFWLPVYESLGFMKLPLHFRRLALRKKAKEKGC